jgi:hypothetical protein
MAENSIEAIGQFVQNFSSPLEDESCYHQLTKMMPHIFGLLDADQTEIIKKSAIDIVNVLLLTQAQVVSDNMHTYINFLVNKRVQEDTSLLVRWKIVQGITNIMDQRVEIILQHLPNVLDFMTNALKEKDQKVALAATEFWSGILHVVASDI